MKSQFGFIIIVYFLALFFHSGIIFADSTVIELSLDDVTRLALENSLDIQIAKYDAYIKRKDLPYEQSIFDAFLNLGAEYDRDKSKSASSFAAGETIEEKYSVELEKKFPYGTTVKIGASNTENKSNSTYLNLNPSQDAAGSISIAQELGRNFFGLADRGKIKITKLGIENGEYTSLDNIETALYAAQLAYWNFVLKCEELSIAEDMFQKSQNLHSIYKGKYGIGLVERGDLLAVEANMRVRENELLSAQIEKETAKNELLFLLNQQDLSIAVEPVDSLEISVFSVDLENSLKDAVENRRDYKKEKNNITSYDIDVVAKRNALWPEIDLEATYNRNGLNTNLRRAWTGVTAEDNPDIFVGLSVNIPVNNREAGAEYDVVKLKKQRAVLSLKRVERSILKEINNRVQKVNMLKNQVEVFGDVVFLQEGKLKEEWDRLKYGRSGSDLVIRYEEDLLQARLADVRALYNYRINLIGLDADKNTLLAKYWDQDL